MGIFSGEVTRKTNDNTLCMEGKAQCIYNRYLDRDSEFGVATIT
jgi:hypothetical protein